MMIRRMCCAACAVLALAGGAAAGRPAPAQSLAVVSRALFKGNVLDDADDKPIAGATVAIEMLRLSVVTDSAGGFLIPRMPAGRHLVVVKRLGYNPVTALVTVGATDTLDYEFALIKQPETLPAVAIKTPAAVAPKLAEFDERRRTGFGRFITQDILEKNKDRRLSEVFATLPGPRIVRGTGSYGWIASSVGPGGIQRRNSLSPMDIARGADPKQCYAAVMLDGNRVYSGRPGEQLFDVNSLGTNTIAGIEYYRDAATVPMKFNVTGGGESCGLVVIWTR